MSSLHVAFYGMVIFTTYILLGRFIASLFKFEIFLEKQVYSAAFGFLVSMPITITAYFVFPPSGRRIAISLVIFISLILAYFVDRKLRSFARDSLLLGLVSIFSFYKSGSLEQLSGVSAGNGDLPYYLALAKLLSFESSKFQGWVSNYDMSQDLFNHWGYGGVGGASNLSFSNLTTNQSIASLFLPTFLSYILVIFGLLLIFQNSGNNTKINRILIAATSTFNVFVFYLVSQGFTQMFISLIAVLTVAGVYSQLNISSPKTKFKQSGVLLITSAATLVQLIAYPVFSAPYIGILILTLTCKLYATRKSKENWELQSYYLLAIVGTLLPIILWPARIESIIKLIPLYTSGAPGWKFQIANPNSLVGLQKLDQGWNNLAISLMLVIVLVIILYFSFHRKRLNILMFNFLILGFALTLVFGIRDGFTSYTAWKASYFLSPFAIYYLLIAITNQSRSNSFGVDNFSRTFLTQIRVHSVKFLFGLALFAIFTSIYDKTIPMYKSPNSELFSLIERVPDEKNLVMALGPLEQLWSIYLTDRPITFIAQNTMTSQASVRFSQGDYFISFKDSKLIETLCPKSFGLNFKIQQETTWFKLVIVGQSSEFACN